MRGLVLFIAGTAASVSALSAASVFAANAPAPPSSAQTQAEPRQPQPIYKSIWREDANSNIVHLQSGLACDAEIGGFRRTEVHIYNPSGLDVSCNYAKASAGDITLYLTRRAGRSLDDDFAEAERQMLQVYPDATNAPLPTTPAIAGIARSAFYTRQGGQLHEGIWIGDVNGWTLEYRGTWLPAGESATLAGIAALTEKTLGSAGAQLALCAKSPAPARDGTAVTDRDRIQQTVVLSTAIGMAAALEPEKNALPAAPRVWCAESVIGEGDDARMLWHAVSSDGSDAEADKVTEFTVGEPVPLLSEPDGGAMLVLDEAAKTKSDKKLWGLTFSHDDETWLFGFYDGRPSAADLAKISVGIAHQTARSVASFNLKTKNITIVTGK